MTDMIQDYSHFHWAEVLIMNTPDEMSHIASYHARILEGVRQKSTPLRLVVSKVIVAEVILRLHRRVEDRLPLPALWGGRLQVSLQ